jgi:hypothetical protein
MEVYILDSLLRRTHVVDKFESLIWTERFSDIGDFELVLNSTREARALFAPETQLTINKSYRVMTVETVEDVTDSEGKMVLTIKGRSLEALLEDRLARNNMLDLVVNPKWILTDTPGDIIREMFDTVCRDGDLDLQDKIPFLMPGSLFQPGTILEFDENITWEQEPDTLFNAMKAIADLYTLGFRITRNFDMSELYFDVYSGNDRTSQQEVMTAVIFTPEFDNLQNVTEFTTIEKSKNVAYVFSDVGTAVVYPEHVDPDVDGFERRVLLVTTSEVNEDTVDIPAELERIGQAELLKHRGSYIFDGEVDQTSNYVYGVDYDLGDLVEMRNIDHVITNRRVTEQIFVCDAEGERSYPTLTMNDFLGSGTWASWRSQQVWEDFVDEHWAEM